MDTSKWIWVTGVTGFTGPFLLAELRKRYPGLKVLGMGRSSNCDLALDQYVAIDLAASPDLNSLVKKYQPSMIFHLAGAMPPVDDALMWHVNITSAYELIKALIENQLQDCKYLNVGTAAEFVQNDSGQYTEEDVALGQWAYGKSKAAQARMVRAFAEEFNIEAYFARPFNFLGPNLPTRWVAGRLCEQLVNSKEAITLGNLQAERDFVDIRDVASAYCDILEKGKTGEFYNVCTGVSTSIQSLVDSACALLGSACPEVKSDAVQLKREEVSRVYGDPAKLVTECAWKAKYSLNDSLRDMLNSYRSSQ